MHNGLFGVQGCSTQEIIVRKIHHFYIQTPKYSRLSEVQCLSSGTRPLCDLRPQLGTSGFSWLAIIAAVKFILPVSKFLAALVGKRQILVFWSVLIKLVPLSACQWLVM